MVYPKWKYRKHPQDGYFQQTLVLHAEAEAELDADWSDDPASTGLKVRPAAQMHHSHFTPGGLLHEVVTDPQGTPLLQESEAQEIGANDVGSLEAVIDIKLNGDTNHV